MHVEEKGNSQVMKKILVNEVSVCSRRGNLMLVFSIISGQVHTETYLNSLKNSVNVAMIAEVLCTISLCNNFVVCSTQLIFAFLEFIYFVAIIKCVCMTLLKNGIIQKKNSMITWFSFIMILGSWDVCVCPIKYFTGCLLQFDDFG